MHPRVRCEHALPIVGMEELDEEQRVRDPFVGRVSQHRLELRTRVDVRARRIDPVDVGGEWKLFDERPVADLRQPQGLLARLAVGDVTEASREERRTRGVDLADGQLGREA